MTLYSPLADLARRCLIDLEDKSENVEQFARTFFERESPDLGEHDRLRVLFAAYNVAGDRMEALQDESKHYAESALEDWNPYTALEAFRCRELSMKYLRVFKHLGSYSIRLQQEGALPGQRH